MTTVKDVEEKKGNYEGMPWPLYEKMPYVILSTSPGDEGVVLFAGTLEEIAGLGFYYHSCEVEVRQHDLHLNDNTRIGW